MYRLEHRGGERFAVDIPIQVGLGPAAENSGRVRNLSLSGALLQIEIDLRVNSLIQIRLSRPALLNCDELIEAHVIRRGDGEVGIEWLDFGSGTVRALLDLPSMRSVLA